MKNLFLTLLVRDCKVISKITMSGSRDIVNQRAAKIAAKYGYQFKVFPAHYGAFFGQIKLDHLHNKQTIATCENCKGTGEVEKNIFRGDEGMQIEMDVMVKCDCQNIN